jgi:hypothetical protein
MWRIGGLQEPKTHMATLDAALDAKIPARSPSRDGVCARKRRRGGGGGGGGAISFRQQMNMRLLSATMVVKPVPELDGDDDDTCISSCNIHCIALTLPTYS